MLLLFFFVFCFTMFTMVYPHTCAYSAPSTPGLLDLSISSLVVSLSFSSIPPRSVSLCIVVSSGAQRPQPKCTVAYSLSSFWPFLWSFFHFSFSIFLRSFFDATTTICFYVTVREFERRGKAGCDKLILVPVR